ncbi:ribonuclease III [Thermodesulfatator atlanticus]|uniref:ribonuclease III n=1 Tax=Thermodesulfatator atlanticus TaxID=501497 RepID=UPI0003B56B69|nr:ribonuclease III [Thermodesulfatator atlanticus]
MASNDYLAKYQELLLRLSKCVGFRFKNELFYLKALTHRSFLGDHPDWPYGDNELLEFLGDAVLGAVISHLLFERYGKDFREGELSKMRAWLVNEERLSKVAQKIGLSELILLGTGEERGGGRKKPSILASAFEALVAAIYLDRGYEKAFEFVRGAFARVIPQAKRGLLSDYKTVLQEITQARFKKTPKYVLIEASGPEHAKKFLVEVRLNGEVLAKGKGRSKKAAEQEAAKQALKILEEKYGTKGK